MIKIWKDNISYKASQRKFSGKIAVQCKWIPANSSEYKGAKQTLQDSMLQMLALDRAAFSAKFVETGYVELLIIQCVLNKLPAKSD